jgi:ribosomal-protein-alanine N-acetyltransferase
MPPAAARVVLERPSARHEKEFLLGVARSRRLHAGWVEPPDSAAEYRAYLRRCRRENQESFFVVVPEARRLAGVVNVNGIIRYSFQSGSLGYYAFHPYGGLGLMAEGLRLVIDRGFGELALHRLEANVQPPNTRSIRLVEGLGFTFEGLSRRFLKIGGRWKDHQRWALLSEDWRAQASHRRRATG